VVLQGHQEPGKPISKNCCSESKCRNFLHSVHAETSYSDFIYGIKPNLEAGNVSYVEQKGIFYESLKKANENPEKNIVLIIDEINRANLSNILGPIFYLFEYQLEDKKESIDLDIGGGYRVSKIPSNYYVICTMNTADRSLAVVDFALRRRFAWYTLKPKEIESIDGRQFFREDFREFSRISIYMRAVRSYHCNLVKHIL
jgi:5-methylcytosine-specific restriction protein B